MKQINLGIVISSDGSQWTGGLEYYINLLRAIQAANSSKKIKMVGLIMPGLNVTQVERLREFFEEVYFLKQQTTLQKAYEYLKDKKIARLFSSFIKSPVESAMLRQKLDVVFAPFELAEYIRLPTITWFADFQHVYFPDFFPDAEVANRNRVFEKAGARAKVIILSSEAAFADFEKFFPAYASKARVLKFVAHLPDEALTGNTERVVKRYNLPNKFYYLPNQFWMHKNHQVVLDALEICIKKNPEICVVCS
ncbi:MAG: hypothetical protein LC108_11445, partial [Anaerolineales bacterium]|nr:hypothetical protein [Anaerolineales bacterium]